MAAPTCATSFATEPIRSSRAISEACNVGGTSRPSSGVAETACATPVGLASSTALVNSSTNSGTPSVRSAISLTISLGSVRVPATLRISAAPALWSRRFSTIELTCDFPGPYGLKLGAVGDQQQYRQACHALDCPVEQLARARIDPLCVLEDGHDWMSSRQSFKLLEPERRSFSPSFAAGERAIGR